MAVREIKGWSEITHLPKQPDYVRGVLNLRGVMVPIIDLRCRFGQGKTEATALHVVIVVQVEARLIGLLADRVLDILSFEASQVQAVPQIARSSRVDFLSGLVTIDGTMIALVDLPNLLAEQFNTEDAAEPEPAASRKQETDRRGCRGPAPVAPSGGCPSSPIQNQLDCCTREEPLQCFVYPTSACPTRSAHWAR